jgi:hypothetical protein
MNPDQEMIDNMEHEGCAPSYAKNAQREVDNREESDKEYNDYY